RVKYICEKERLKYQPEADRDLRGDLRKAIMFLQSAQQFTQDQVLTKSAIETLL
ncbi:hypothetical protein L0F63_006551, partial [Massospora cicadina]